MTRAPELVTRPMRWWDIEALMPLEADLFGSDAWPATTFWSELAQHDTRHYLVATEGEEVVGYAGLCVYPDEAYVQTIGVRPDRQGQGIGARLLELLLAEADRRGKRLVGLEVRADNARAQRLYARYGFEPVTIRPRYYQPSGVDALIMQRVAP